MLLLSLALALSSDIAGAAEFRAPLLDVESTFPAPETVVPENGRIVFFGAPDPTLTFARIHGDGTEDALESTQVGVDQFQAAHVVALPAAVVTGEQIVIASRCANCVFSGAWTIGAADTTAPTFDDGPARVTAQRFDGGFGGSSGGYAITIELPAARDDGGPVAVELRGDLARLGPEVFAPGAPITIFASTLDDSERTACFQAVALDAAGNEATLDDTLCVELVHPLLGGCAQTSPSSGFVGALVLAMLALARRRRTSTVRHA